MLRGFLIVTRGSVGLLVKIVFVAALVAVIVYCLAGGLTVEE